MSAQYNPEADEINLEDLQAASACYQRTLAGIEPATTIAPRPALDHKPGPWRWVQYSNDYLALEGSSPPAWSDPTILAVREDWATWRPFTDSPNARLIAAAPELLEAARLGLAWLDYWRDRVCLFTDEHAQACDQLRAAIARAAGQEVQL